MTEQTRHNILRYGIALDLVILATGAGMLFEPSPAALLVGAFSGAVILSSWRGGWRAAAAAFLLSIVVLLFVFPAAVSTSTVMLLAGIATIGTTVLLLSQKNRSEPPRGQETEASSIILDDDTTRDGAGLVPQLSLVSPVVEREAIAETVLDRELVREVAEPDRTSDDVSPGATVIPHSKGDRKRKKKGRGPADRAAQEYSAEEREQRARDEAEATRREQEERAAAEAEATRLRDEAQAAEAARLREEAQAAEALRLHEAEEARAALETQRREAEERAAAAERAAEELRARTQAEEAARAKLEEEARRAAELERQLEEERRAAQAERERLLADAQTRAEEEARRTLEEAQARAAKELEERLAREREETEKRVEQRIEAERRAAEDAARRELEAGRAALRQREEALQAELAKSRKNSETPAAAPRRADARRESPAPSAVGAIVSTLSSWFRSPKPQSQSVNLKSKRVAANGVAGSAARRQAKPLAKPRLLMIERRRGTADAALEKLRQRAIDIVVVERWVDAVDELFRFRPHALTLDVDHPDFDQIHRTISDKASQLPIILTGKSPLSAGSAARHATFVIRPYDVEELARLAHAAHSRPADLLAQQTIGRQRAVPEKRPAPPAQRPGSGARPTPRAVPAVVKPPSIPAAESENAAASGVNAAASSSSYEIACYTCRASFEAVDADWCSCLAKERTLVCTNCLACFCKAPPSYKEKFWVEAPPRLFERKTAEARKGATALPENPGRESVVRPLVLTVEDDEEIQAIVQRVCANLGYGFIWATNGQDGLELARAYRPNMILSDAFMPKLDGREMCRLLKESGELPDTRMVVMTGLYTDTKYRSEAVRRFHVDDYIAKPVSVTELINILQKHLEGVAGLPAQEDLHEVHRAQLEEQVEEEVSGDNDVPLADIIAMPSRIEPPKRSNAYEVCCFGCQQTFDATNAEWCSCVGRDNTLVCPNCNGCFCKAPADYRERFWIDAPSSLFERKMIGSKRQITIRDNPPASDVKRPMILLVEDDENVQLIVRTVVSSMGYGFVVGADGQEGLTLAREYNPELILSDAFMPKLDGREMCRLLKEDPMTAASKAIIMTGLYTDRKYRNEALDYFKVDDYVAKPLAVDDLIRLFKKHLPIEVARAN